MGLHFQSSLPLRSEFRELGNAERGTKEASPLPCFLLVTLGNSSPPRTSHWEHNWAYPLGEQFAAFPQI